MINACNKPKHGGPCKDNGFVFRKVTIPAQLGDDKTGQAKPENGAYTNSMVVYEASGAKCIYDSNGVYTIFSEHPVLSVNGKTGEVVLSTSDLENDSGYVTGEFVDDAVDGAITLEAALREAADDQLNDRVDDVAGDVALETSLRQDADSGLSDRIVAETEARREADSGLQSQIDAISASSDVTDIVGTYAALQAYDVSKLKDNDIIKVLQDESQNDETTYYRWSTGTEAFTLIGEEGPYYTKAAADTKFQDKLTAGSNITIDANNEISATDTTYSDFVGTDGTTDGEAGLVPAPTTADDGKFLKADGTWGTVSAGPTVVQTTGTSTTDVMSQAATSRYAVGTTESYTIADTDWAALSGASPYTYSADIAATYTIGNGTIVELLNDQAVLFGTYGFAIGAVNGQTVTIYSIGAPSSSVTLKVNYKG